MNSSMIYCSNCGAGNQSRATYCFSCGKALQIGTLPTMSGTGRLSPQQLLKQRYKIVTLIGQGGMGAVYKAEDTQFGGRLIAVKEMSQSNVSPQIAAEVAEQFKQEAHMLANLKHPNLPSIYDYFGENGRWYLVMDFIEGSTLHARLNEVPGRVLTLTETLDIGIQLTKVLGYLHTRPAPIIFRDLKPLNIMITPEDNIYLIDFGIARIFKPGQAKDTIAYVSTGYAAPEQFGEAQTSPQSDIYSLGAILHQLLSGNKPSSNIPIFTFQPLKTYNLDVPAALENLISTMINIDPTRRPKSMAVIRQELEHIQTALKQPAPLPQTQYVPTPTPQQQYTPPPTLHQQYAPSPSTPSAQEPERIQHTPSPQAAEKPALPTGRVWKTLLIGIITGTSLYFLALPLTNFVWLWITLSIAVVLLAGFITSRIVVLQRMGLFMGCIAGITIVAVALIQNPTDIGGALNTTLLLVSSGGVLGLSGAWLGTIRHH